MKPILDEVLALALTLTHAEQEELIRRLSEHILEQRTSATRPLTADEKIRLLESIKIDVAIKEEPSIRREDWYGDDGR